MSNKKRLEEGYQPYKKNDKIEKGYQPRPNVQIPQEPKPGAGYQPTISEGGKPTPPKED